MMGAAARAMESSERMLVDSRLRPEQLPTDRLRISSPVNSRRTLTGPAMAVGSAPVSRVDTEAAIDLITAGMGQFSPSSGCHETAVAPQTAQSSRAESYVSSNSFSTHVRKVHAAAVVQALLATDEHKPALTRNRADAPICKLSANLLKTYKTINTVYYKSLKKQPAAPPKPEPAPVNDGYDDEKGDYKIRNGELFAERFVVMSLLGRGSFGQVVKAWDKVENDFVAIKIIKNRLPFYNQALIEIKTLLHIGRKDPSDKFSLVRLKQHFVFRNHLCLVFELLSYNLYDLLRNTGFRGISLPLIRKLAQQMLRALYFLSNAEVDVIHCDLKPENILLVNSKRSTIKLIDFGSSCRSREKMYKYIQSRFYRSPEVILELEYTHAIDMWSLGCMLVELHTGEPLFTGQSELDQMNKICAVFGLPPSHLIERSPKAKKFFVAEPLPDGSKRYSLLSPNKSLPKHSLAAVMGISSSGGPIARRFGDSQSSDLDYLKFRDLVTQMLTYDPAKRITPANALAHSFFVQTSDAETASLSLSPPPPRGADERQPPSARPPMSPGGVQPMMT
eukprot:TRINITY_DN7572_c0_g1_i1.p1 TRINITY_DN7572_c0_g1~~TRINITY_DN7572_c0_g1_i1.p1  ORF type:complete len:562 (+),score=170.73 TRINITY_DN7572_c0_g1_i1:85-1770(+)